MKTIIAGSRKGIRYEEVLLAIHSSGWWGEITEVVCGMAPGVDLHGKTWADIEGIPVKEMPADWDKYGRSAGFKRNVQMADYAGRDGALLAVWDGKSTGTGNMIRIAHKRKMRVFVYVSNRFIASSTQP